MGRLSRRREYDRSRSQDVARRAWMRDWIPRGKHRALLKGPRIGKGAGRGWRVEPAIPWATVSRIRWMVHEGHTRAEAARLFGISYSHLCAIVAGRARAL